MVLLPKGSLWKQTIIYLMHGNRRRDCIFADMNFAWNRIRLNCSNFRTKLFVAIHSIQHKVLSHLLLQGVAFLYVAEHLQEKTRPMIISHGFGSGFSSEFIWSGLRDYR